ncbi:MAG: DUF4157 domain-containing protein [Bacteroidota bacterium]
MDKIQCTKKDGVSKSLLMHFDTVGINTGQKTSELSQNMKSSLESVKPIMKANSSAQTPSIQMKCAKCEEEEKLQMKPSIQRSSTERKEYAGDHIGQKINSAKGRGNALPDHIGHEIGNKIGADFSSVKVHTDSNATQMNRELGARAFTHGNDIYFNSGEYNPSKSEGKYLLAHELTHVVQQGFAQQKIQRSIGDGHDLTADRFSGNERLEAAYDDERYIRFGSKGEHVVKLQESLVEIGYDLPKFGADGIFGKETYSAVKTFQRDFGLAIDGIVGPKTMGTLDNIFSVQLMDMEEEEDLEPIVLDGDSSQGLTVPVGDEPLSSKVQKEGGGIQEFIQTKLDPPPKKLKRPPAIVKITIDLTAQNIKTKWSDKRETGPYHISSGKGCPNTKGDPCKNPKRSDKDTYCTPAGKGFKVEGLGGEKYKNRNGDSMSWYVAFVASRGIGIHNAQPVTGTPKSHGCVRVEESVAKMIHNNVTTKTKIDVIGKAPIKKYKKSKKATQKGYPGCPLPPTKKKKKKKK